MNSDIRRLFLALILSMAAIFGWNYFYVNPKMKTEEVAKRAEQGDKKWATNDLIEKTRPIAGQNNSVIPNMAEGSAQTTNNNSQATSNALTNVTSQLASFSTQQTREQALASGQRVKLSTGRLHGSINLVGGMLDDLSLAKYRQSLDKTSPEVVLLSPRRTEHQYFISTGWLAVNPTNIPSPSTGEGQGEGDSSETINLPNDNTIWSLESGKELTPESPVTISYNNGAGLIFRKTFAIDDKYMVTVKQSVENKSASPISISPFGLINRSYDMKQKQVYVSHEGPIAVTDKKLNDAKYSSLADDKLQEFKTVSGWIAMGDKYWLTSIIPQNSSIDKFDIAFKYYQKDGIDRFQTDILSSQPLSLAPNSQADYTFNIYAGAKQVKIIETYQKALNIDLFDRSIDFGSLYFLTKPMLKALIYFHSLIGNMGLAIMLLTICVRLILFPLANKSYSSMARMKKHMPEINKLKERFKTDRQKQGTEMMKYYKEHRINPASGCLPIFIQIPVFFALYKVLYVTIEMRHEPFFWFIRDLSAQDPTNIFTLFGLAVWNVPQFLPHIGILPILFSTTMVIQQKLNPPMADETQRIIMNWMPWIFLFVFSNFAAGLVVYWIWNNLLSILQQYIITRKVEEDKNE